MTPSSPHITPGSRWVLVWRIDQEIYEQIMEISLNQEAVFIGDLNLPVSKWGDPLSSHAGQDLYMDLQDSSLYHFVQSPTSGNNILDLVLATSEDLVDNIKVGDVFSNSNHCIITFTMKFNCCRHNSSNELSPYSKTQTGEI